MKQEFTLSLGKRTMKLKFFIKKIGVHKDSNKTNLEEQRL